jgi:hypothetical protein
VRIVQHYLQDYITSAILIITTLSSLKAGTCLSEHNFSKLVVEETAHYIRNYNTQFNEDDKTSVFHE